MIHFTDMTGLAGSALAIAAMVFLASGAARMPRPRGIVLACIAAILALVPFGGLPLAAYLRGAIGDLSITSLVLLAMAIMPVPSGQSAYERNRLALLALVALGAVCLYPMALGIGYFDPYRLGFGNMWFLAGLLTLALAASFQGLALVAFILSLSVLAWSIGWYESNNLWDSLLDPLVSVYAIGALIRRCVQTLSGSY